MQQKSKKSKKNPKKLKKSIKNPKILENVQKHRKIEKSQKITFFFKKSENFENIFVLQKKNKKMSKNPKISKNHFFSKNLKIFKIFFVTEKK